MATHNIQIGIDLGTTNSEIAVNDKGKIEIIKNVWQDEYTPSVFGFDKSQNKIVGKKAYEKLFKDGSPEEEKNYKAEVKRIMGTSEDVEFPNAHVKLNAEEISAEILRSLREDVQRKYDNIYLDAAVITVPAYFSIVQKEATKRAGNLAGFKYVVLLQEPISAAMSYGFNNNQNEGIIVYDLGGGTFDVAVVASRDGVISVLDQNGDNFLGGKDIDRLIVDEVIIPKILEKYPELEDIIRSQIKYKAVFAKLKYLSEKAKIELTQLDKTSIDIDITDKSLNTKDNNIYLNFELSRNDLEELVKPIIEKTIALTDKTIESSGIKKSQIKRIVLVGGPTQMPIIKRMLEEKIGINVDLSSDPLTAVSRGAAIFALGQNIPQEMFDKTADINNGEIVLDINYDSLTSEDEQLIVGLVKSDIKDGCYLQIQSESGYYNGPKVPINNGKFKTTLQIEQNKNNVYWIYVFDDNGNQLKVSPESISITHGLTVGSAQISRSIGVSLRSMESDCSEKMYFFFRKGDRLPLEKKKSFHTAQRLKKDDKTNQLNINFIEGESDNPKNNTYIAQAGIFGADIPHDIPEGADIDITIKIDESNILIAEWYLPIIDKGGNARVTLMDESLSVEDLRVSLDEKRQKAAKIESDCNEDEKDLIEQRISEVNKSLANAKSDEDSKRKANKDIKELGIDLDELEKSKKMPQLQNDFRKKVNNIRELIKDIGIEEDNKSNLDQLKCLEDQGEKAISVNDRIILSQTVDDLSKLSSKVLWSNPQTYIYYFNELKKGEIRFTNQEDADYYFGKGEKAIESNDFDSLKSSVVGLIGLISSDDMNSISDKISGIMS